MKHMCIFLLITHIESLGLSIAQFNYTNSLNDTLFPYAIHHNGYALWGNHNLITQRKAVLEGPATWIDTVIKHNHTNCLLSIQHRDWVL